MQPKGNEPGRPKPSAMPATDDEIREKYLERAIRELNLLNHDIHDCAECPRGSLMPVLGSGHPQADIVLLKHDPSLAEIEEGVAFYGRSGTAVMKSLKRLGIDPLAVYGTLCAKCPISDRSFASGTCVGRLALELAIVQPKIVVAMGEPALEALNDLSLPLGRELSARPGELQDLTPSMRALFTPDIDASLDDEASKRAFWAAFRVLGDWYAELPPY